VEVDLSHDARQQPAGPTEVGPTLTQDELAADKVLALYGRGGARLRRRGRPATPRARLL
jgi:hypothetical protein